MTPTSSLKMEYVSLLPSFHNDHGFARAYQGYPATASSGRLLNPPLHGFRPLTPRETSVRYKVNALRG